MSCLGKVLALVLLLTSLSLVSFLASEPAKAGGISISIKESFFQETYLNQPVTITATPLSGEPPYTYQWYTQLWSSGSDGKPLGPITPFPNATSSTFRFIESTAGTYDISLQINDSAGNGDYDSFPISGVWVIVQPLPSSSPISTQANSAPTISIVYPTNETVFNVSINGVYFQLLYQTNDTLSWVGYSIDGGANVTCTGNTTDNSEFTKDDYRFDFGHPTLTLYANDTAGNWAIPQTVTYTVYFYSDSTSAPQSTFPNELILPIVISLFLVLVAMAIVIYRKKHSNYSKVTEVKKV